MLCGNGGYGVWAPDLHTPSLICLGFGVFWVLIVGLSPCTSTFRHFFGVWVASHLCLLFLSELLGLLGTELYPWGVFLVGIL